MWISIFFSFGVGMIVFLSSPGRQKLVSFITSARVIIYSGQCVSVAALRKQLPDVERPFRMPARSAARWRRRRWSRGRLRGGDVLATLAGGGAAYFEETADELESTETSIYRGHENTTGGTLVACRGA